MHNEINQLLIYRNIINDPVISIFCKFLEAVEKEKKIEHLFHLQYCLINHKTIKVKYWREFILELTLFSENLFTLKCEKKEPLSDEFLSLVSFDISVLRNMYNYPWEQVLKDLDVIRPTLFSLDKGVYNKHLDFHNLFINKNIKNESLMKELADYIGKIGTGLFSKFHVFKWDDREGALREIKDYDIVKFEDLIGYKRQINLLKENTLNFIEKGKGNNVLLYGQRGTGKSSSIKALVPEFASSGLRVIEVKKQELALLPRIIEEIKGRNFKFIIFIDDLSFEEFETDYKHFKAIMEGSFEKRPDNALIYVTSNRRHLVRETFKEREEDIHHNETSQEKLSLFDRFGLTILYEQPKDELYNEMVLELARRSGIKMSKEELLIKANEWKISKSIKSGRAAKQLIDSLSTKN